MLFSVPVKWAYKSFSMFTFTLALLPLGSLPVTVTVSPTSQIWISAPSISDSAFAVITPVELSILAHAVLLNE